MTEEYFKKMLAPLLKKWPSKEMWMISSQELFNITKILTERQFEQLIEHALQYTGPKSPIKAHWEAWTHKFSYTVPKIDLDPFNEEIGPVKSHSPYKHPPMFKAEPIDWGSGVDKFLKENNANSLIEMLEKRKPRVDI